MTQVKNTNCSCQYCSNKQYHVDITAFQKKRLNGISGILRVKNDAEFLAEAIDSCIDALDELIIVYNDCSDESTTIIRRKADEYVGKIKYYEYAPPIYANNLSEEEYEFIKLQPADSPHLLANYYNYALSKVNYKYVMKIDADQIYFSDDLKQLCDAYRCKSQSFINPWALICFIYFYVNLLVYKKSGFSFPFKSRYLFRKYRSVLLSLVRNFKISVYLSGYNMFYKDKLWYVSLGKKNDRKINILPPYNGVTDHSIFSISDCTYFVPIEMEDYAKLNSHKHSVIEVLRGVGVAFPYGFMWMHLNGMRRNIYQQQVDNFAECNDRFLLFAGFAKKKFKDINCTSDLTILSQQNYLLYSALHDVFNHEENEKYIKKYYIMNDDNMLYLKRYK